MFPKSSHKSSQKASGCGSCFPVCTCIRDKIMSCIHHKFTQTSLGVVPNYKKIILSSVYVNIGDNIEMTKFLGPSRTLNLENVSSLISYFEHLGPLSSNSQSWGSCLLSSCLVESSISLPFVWSKTCA
jgi:hypothetical protein